MAGSDRSRLTVVEYLRDPAVPTDWMFNVGLRSIWQQTHKQLAEVIGPYVNPSLTPVDFTSTPGHLLFDSNDDVFIYYGLYKVWLGFFNGLDIDVINGTCNFGPSVIGAYPGQPVSNNSQGVLVLRIVEKRFHSGSTLADLEGGSSGSNAYGNIKIPQDLQATFGSNTFDTHNEWRVKALLYTAPTYNNLIRSFFETVDTKTTDIVIGLFNVDNSGNITNFNYLIPIQNDTIGSLLNSFAGRPFSVNHRVAFTDSKNRFLDTQSLVVKYGQAKIDNANNLVHNITGSPDDLSGNQLEVLLPTNNFLKNLPTGSNYPDGTTLTLFTSSGTWLIDFSGNIKMSPEMLATYSVLSLHQVLGLFVPINSGQPVTFLRVGSFWYIMSPEPYQMLNKMMFTTLDESLLHWKWLKQHFGSGSSSPGNRLFDRYFLGTTVNVGTGALATHTVTQQCFEKQVNFGSTSFTNLTWLSSGSYFLVKYRNNLTPVSSQRSYVDLEIEIYFEIDSKFQGWVGGFLLGPPSAALVDSPFKATSNDVTPITDMIFQFVYFFQHYSFLRTNLLQVLDLPSFGQNTNTNNVIHLNGSLVIWPNLNNFPVEFQSLPLSGFLQFDKTNNSVTKFSVRGTLTHSFWSQWYSLVTNSLVSGKFGEACDVIRLHGRYYFK
jgi:hypothetical protein